MSMWVRAGEHPHKCPSALKPKRANSSVEVMKHPHLPARAWTLLGNDLLPFAMTSTFPQSPPLTGPESAPLSARPSPSHLRGRDSGSLGRARPSFLAKLPPIHAHDLWPSLCFLRLLLTGFVTTVLECYIIVWFCFLW